MKGTSNDCSTAIIGIHMQMGRDSSQTCMHVLSAFMEHRALTLVTCKATVVFTREIYMQKALATRLCTDFLTLLVLMVPGNLTLSPKSPIALLQSILTSSKILAISPGPRLWRFYLSITSQTKVKQHKNENSRCLPRNHCNTLEIRGAMFAYNGLLLTPSIAKGCACQQE